MTRREAQDKLVVVRTYFYRHEAEIGRAMLEANGIDAMILADDFGGLQPALGADTGVRLLVRREDEDAAKELLE
ncbi:MAG TPA: DUF2007 domain-containing protein [Candidatus Acidoferrales bacterium]|nr:DUF2007 domain-containing protein [Candidatus Acidoferrales bacterium]